MVSETKLSDLCRPLKQKKESNINICIGKLISAMLCKQPRFRGQQIIKKDGKFSVDEENSLIFKANVLNETELSNYLLHAVNVDRRSGKSGFGVKPRREVCYTVDGNPYRYSNVNHQTIKYPQHVLDIVPVLQKVVTDHIPANTYTQLSNGVDIIYSDEFSRGGSISAHADDEDDWGLVVILSLGQTRWLRVRRKSDKRWINVQMAHNSAVAMYGPTFQKLYTHQVDKLAKDDKVGTRLSLNLRFKQACGNVETKEENKSLLC